MVRGAHPPPAMQVVHLLVNHDCPFSRPVKQVENVRVTHLCHRGAEAILELHAPDAKSLGRLLDEYRAIDGEVIYEERDRTAALVRFDACACCRSGRVIPTIEGLGYLYLPPSAYGADGESYEFLAEETRLDPHLRERLPDGVTVERAGTQPLRSLEFEGGFLVPVGVLFEGLTDRQRLALVSAILRGYYRIPRKVTTEELALSLSISRPAYEALLRKAENKLIAALFPYLTLGSAVGSTNEAAGSPP